MARHPRPGGFAATRLALRDVLLSPLDDGLSRALAEARVFDSATLHAARAAGRPLTFRDFLGCLERRLENVAAALAGEERAGGVVSTADGPVGGGDAAMIINRGILRHRNLKTLLQTFDRLTGPDAVGRAEREHAARVLADAVQSFRQVMDAFQQPSYSPLMERLGMAQRDMAVQAAFHLLLADWDRVDRAAGGPSR